MLLFLQSTQSDYFQLSDWIRKIN